MDELLRFIAVTSGSVFLVAGTLKTTDASQLGRFVARAGILPRKTLRPVLRTVIVTEIVVGAALVYGQPLIPALGGALLLASLFVMVSVIALARGVTESCGCFGATSRATRASARVLARPLLLFVIVGITFFWTVMAGPQPHRPWFGSPTADLGIGLGLLLVFLSRGGWHSLTAVLHVVLARAPGARR
jgi:hypothetical protein